MLKQLEKEKPVTIGILQALLVTGYCGLIATFFNYISRIVPRPGFFGFFLMLMLLVFSAAATGSLVFGYPVYLGLVKKKVKEALTILGFTLGFSLIMIMLAITFLVLSS